MPGQHGRCVIAPSAVAPAVFSKGDQRVDGSIFDGLSRTVGRRQGLRSLVSVLGGAALTVPLLVAGETLEAGAARRKVQGEHNRREGGKKTIVCYQGETVRVATKRRKQWFRKGATRGRCDDMCTPVCMPGTCGDDGCGGTCGCGAGTVCVETTCEPCDVACLASASVCGATLATAINSGGVIRVCPGEYQGTFYPLVDAEIYGAGNGPDPAISTILVGDPAETTEAVICIENSATLLFANLRVTGGNNLEGPGGVDINGGRAAPVTLRNCVITGNTGTSGGGINVDNGNLTLDGCEITGNVATARGGGIFSDSILNVTNTTISDNSAPDGGGLYVNNGTTTLAASVTITANTATNAGNSGGGIFVAGGTATVSGATVTGNTPDQCSGVAC